MTQRIRRRISDIVGVLVMTLAVAAVWPVEAQRGAAANAANATVRSLADRAAKGDYSPHEAQDALSKAGMSDIEADKAMEHINSAFKKFDEDRWAAKKKQEEDARKAEDDARQDREKAAAEREKKEQNASGQFEWNLGAVYRDRDYDLTMPIANNCRIPREVKITYPKAVQLSGPPSVTVPAGGTVDVKMQLKMSTPPMPAGPYPPGFSPACYDLSDWMRLDHEQFVRETETSRYECKSMQKFITVGMHVHQHAPPGSGGGGGGGGGGGKRKDPACETLWKTNEFFATREKPSPEACRTEIQEEARQFFGPLMVRLRTADPSNWAWAPTPAKVEAMSVADIMKAKVRADVQAAPRYDR